MEPEPISDTSQWDWALHTVGGGVDPRVLDFVPPIVQCLDIWNDSWTGDGTLSSPGGVGSIICEPQSIRDWPVSFIGDFHNVWGGINLDHIRVVYNIVLTRSSMNFLNTK